MTDLFALAIAQQPTGRPYSIYRYRNPLTLETCYVGRSGDPDKRFKMHSHNTKSPCYTWIKNLRAQGLEPLRDILETGWEAYIRPSNRFLSDIREAYWINRLKPSLNRDRKDSGSQSILLAQRKPGTSRVTLDVTNKTGKAYRRAVLTQLVTYECLNCGEMATRDILPGATPQYCEACALKIRRAKTRARVARLRAKKGA